MKRAIRTGLPVILLMIALGCSKEIGDPIRPTTPRGSSGLADTLAVPSGASVESAKIHLYCEEAAGTRIRAHRITASWSGSTVTWQNFGAGYDGGIRGTLYAVQGEWVVLEIPSLTQQWLHGDYENLGILLDQDSPEFPRTRFGSREVSGRAPWIELCYSIGGEITCDSARVAVDAYILEESPETNTGASNYLLTGSEFDGTGESMVLLWFDLRERNTSTPPPDGTAEIGDWVWNDDNRNGLRESGESGIPGVTVQLEDCTGNLLAMTTTDGSGFYRFSGLEPGDYRLRFVIPGGWQISPMNQDDDQYDSDADATGRTACTRLDEDERDLSWDCGLYQTQTQAPGSIGTIMWNDANENGIREGGESGVGGARVRLLGCNGAVQAEGITDGGGNYHFEGLSPGDYQMQFLLPSGYQFSPANQGGDDQRDSDAGSSGYTTCFTLTAGVSLSGWDAGVYRKVQAIGCTQKRDWWADHAGRDGDPDEVTPHLPIRLGSSGGAATVTVTSARMARDVLKEDWTRDKNGITKLYAELLAAKLNIASGASDVAIADHIRGTDQFLASYDYADWDDLERGQRQMLDRWKETYKDYNEGKIGPGSCGSGGGDDDDDDDDDDD